MAERKGQDKLDELGGEQFGDVLNKFHEHDLDALQVPQEARPRVGELHQGRHGYTARSKSGAALCPNKDPLHFTPCFWVMYSRLQPTSVMSWFEQQCKSYVRN